MSDLLRTRISTTPAMLAIFSDGATITHALAFETALAAAQAEAGVLPRPVAEAIAQACAAIRIDPADLADEATLAGTLAIPLVKRLRAELQGETAAAVHKAATSQDLADTALMLQVA